MSEFKQYRRTTLTEMRPYVVGEEMTGINVSDADGFPEVGGMIARNSKNNSNQWYISKKYFKDNFVEFIKTPTMT